MTERLPPLRAVEAFIQVVETSSYGKAALALNITKSAISRRIQSLEDDLGVKLFRRSNRALELTADGQKYFKITRSAFDTLREAGAQIKNTRRDDILRIALPQSFASSWLLPRIGTFYETYPNTDLQLNWRGYFNMFEDEDVDVLLTVTEETPPTLHAEKLMDIVWFPVCSPNLLEQSTATLDSIGGQTLLHLTTMPGALLQTWGTAARRHPVGGLGSIGEMLIEHNHGFGQGRGSNSECSFNQAHLPHDTWLQAPCLGLSFA
jgi:LysR family transcriptional regulator, glycine cleavage system transcriptional activator